MEVYSKHRFLTIFILVVSISTIQSIHPRIVKKLGLLAILGHLGGRHQQPHHYPVPLPVPVHAPHIPHEQPQIHHQ